LVVRSFASLIAIQADADITIFDVRQHRGRVTLDDDRDAA
jgi:hypothetical protein